MFTGVTACKKTPDSRRESADTAEDVYYDGEDKYSGFDEEYEDYEDYEDYDEDYDSLEEEIPTTDEHKEYVDLLNKALKLENFYSEYTEYINMTTTEKKVWVKGNKYKMSVAHPNGGYINGYFYIDDGMQYSVYGNKGSKHEIGEEEAESARQSVRWFINLPEYFTHLGVLKGKTSREEDFNGIPCVYLEMEKYDGSIFKVHISKEYGIVMNFELYTDTGKK
jgi:hypothetical protein